MKRAWRGAGVMLAAGLPALWAAAADAEKGRTLSIRAVMHKQYTVSRAPFVVIEKELAAEAPDWEKIRGATGAFADLAATLAKKEPRWGEKASWRRFLDAHLGDAKAMVDAAEGRDKEAILAAHRRLETSCKACHDAHRYRRQERRPAG